MTQNHEEDTRHSFDSYCKKVSNPTYSPVQSAQGKISVKDYMAEWLENYGTVNLRPSTHESYKSIINIHIDPHIGHVPLREIIPSMLDDIFKKKARLVL